MMKYYQRWKWSALFVGIGDVLCILLPTFLIFLQFHNANNSFQIYVNRLLMNGFTKGKFLDRALLT